MTGGPSRLGPVYALAHDLARDHDAGSPGALTVVPVLTDDYDRTLSALRSLCDTSGGAFLNADDDDLAQPVSGAAPSSALVAALETSLSLSTSVRSRALRVVASGPDAMDATYAGGLPPGAMSDGDKTVLAVARQLLNPRLPGGELAVLAYRERSMDPDTRRAVWSLVVDQLPLQDLGRCRTLVVAVEPQGRWIDVSLTCQRKRGFRYAIDGNRLLRRNLDVALESRAAQLARSGNPLTVLFLGAGFSASSRLPMGNALRDAAIKNLLAQPPPGASSNELARLFRDLIKDRMTETEAEQSVDEFVRLLTFERVIREEKRQYPSLPTLEGLRDREASVIGSPGPAVRYLHEVLAGSKRLVVVTVNLDRFIEHDAAGLVHAFATEKEFEQAADYVRRYVAGEAIPVPVLKVHGTITDFDSCVVTDDDTSTGVSAAKRAALTAALEAPGHTPWIYVGASMRDIDLQQFFGNTDFAEQTNEYWVVPYLPDTVEDFAKQRVGFWRKRTPDEQLQERLVTETADTFMEALARHWPR